MSAAGGDVRLQGGPARRARENEILVGIGAGLLAIALAATALQGLSLSASAFPAIVILAIAGPWLLSRPYWVLPLFVAVTWPELRRGTFGGLPTPVELGGPVLLGLAAWYALPRLRMARDVLVVCMLIGGPWLVAGLLSPVDPTIDISLIKDLTFLVIVALGIRAAVDVERIGLALCIGGIALGLGGLLSLTVGEFGPFRVANEGNIELGEEILRAAGSVNDPNFFALQLAAIMPFALRIAGRTGWYRVLGSASLLALLIGIFSTGSRGGLLAAMVGLIFFGLTSSTRAARRATAGALVVAVAFVPLFSGILDTSAERSIEGRATENLVAVHMFFDHPLTGVGPGNYPVLYRDYTRYVGNDARVLRDPHSLPLEIAAEQGIVGLLGWIAALALVARIVIAKRLWRSSLGRATVTTLIVYMTGSLFLHAEQPRLIFMIIGLVLALAAFPPRPRQIVRAA